MANMNFGCLKAAFICVVLLSACHTAEPCSSSEFDCGDGQCIPSNLRCSGITECSNGNDERNCTQGCSINEFQCASGECISAERRCNREYDCPDQSDERSCPCKDDDFQCNNGFCIPHNQRCDGTRQCQDESDELGCDTRACDNDQFRCKSGDCIRESQRCNGVLDCSDQSDEVGCPDCKGEFDCGNGLCLPQEYVCDGFKDCSNGRDEANCSCSAQEFKCNNNNCVPLKAKCDRIRDCSDGSDELECDCLPNEFRCLSSGECLSQYLLCDGVTNCQDNSDEINCGPPPTNPPSTLPPVTSKPRSCGVFHTPCLTGEQCILRNQLCDGTVDCNDLSDESNCEGTASGLQLKTYPNQQEIRENREVVFQCRDEGPIRARVQWKRANGLPLPPGSRDINGRLEIPNIRVEHAGTYICAARDFPLGTPNAEIAVQLYVDKAPPPYIPQTVKCSLNESTCGNGECIARNKVCDGQYDCTDGSDETRCSLQCEPNEFKCDNKKCIHKSWVCDSENDCGDDSDERACRVTNPGEACGPHQFTCANGQCIPRAFHCDKSASDCADKSDEIGCIRAVISQNPVPMERLPVGAILELTCRAVGVPTPEIIWRLNWRHVPPKCTTSSVDGFGTLRCENIQIEDQGAYTCEAISTIGSVMSSDTIVEVYQQSVCRQGYFNADARNEAECLKCFCFGHSSTCRSANLYVYQFQPPFDRLKVLGVQIDPRTGVIDIKDEPIYRGVEPILENVGNNGVKSSLPYQSELNQPNVRPFFALPENYNGNQLKSYGGYLRYNVHHNYDGLTAPGPDVILTGNGYVLLHQSTVAPAPRTTTQMRVRFFTGEWIIKSDREPERYATREEIMMALEDVTNILIKLEYDSATLSTTLSNIVLDSAGFPDSGLGAANFVEQCSCPEGYTGSSCEYCAEGYVRHKTGPWLGQCYKEPVTCPEGSFNNGGRCERCPCPSTTPSNQFASSCYLGSDGEVTCRCRTGYGGRRCEYCDSPYEGNPLVPGGSCVRPPPTRCDPLGTYSVRPDGSCVCKEFTTGLYCNQCKENSFYLSGQNQFGCISCFCMGVSSQCTSSNWFRDSIQTSFARSTNDFKLTNMDKNEDLRVTLNSAAQEIAYSTFNQPDVYYWSLPSKYLGDKVTSYGGYLRYTIRNTPVPGGASSRNNAPDVEIVSEQQSITLLHFSSNKTSSNNQQPFDIPLLEQYWQRHDGLQTDREHLLMALADVSAIYIKATYFTNSQEAALINISLDTATERNTGLQRAWEVEQCQCPQGYTGLSCEDCSSGFTRSEKGIYLELCTPCECNGNSDECHPETGICSNCRYNTDGEYCEQCLPGYTGDPTRGEPCTPSTVPNCNCHPSGSVSDRCYNGVCECKANVEGRNCDRCRNGTFGILSDNSDGCEFCFCSGVSSVCSSSSLFVEQKPVLIGEQHGFTLVNQQLGNVISSEFSTNIGLNEIGYNFAPSQRETMYWSLPGDFTGNQLKSYGGRLEYVQRYHAMPNAKYSFDKDVIIIGNSIVIYWTNVNELKPNVRNHVSVHIYPSANWYKLGQNGVPRPASREDILIVLANIEAILIRATISTDTISSFLSDLTLDTAVDTYNGKARASHIEVCRCPQGYRGTSCESCSTGYYKDPSFSDRNPLGSCLSCPCNGRAASCDYNGSEGVICNCHQGYYGRQCEHQIPDSNVNMWVEITPPRVVAPVGFQQELTCRYGTDSNQQLHFTFQNLNSGVKVENPSVIRTTNGAQASIIAVVGCIQQIYECTIVNSDGIKLSYARAYIKPADFIDPVKNTTSSPPTGPSIVVTISGPGIQIYEVGNTVRLNCSAISKNSPKILGIRWTKDGNELPRHAIDDGRGILFIRNVFTTDSGTYVCEVEDGFSIVTQSVTLQIGSSRYIPPTLVISPPYLQISEGQRIEVRCSASGVPTPDYSLSRLEKQPINPSHSFINGVFIIEQSRATDAGRYQCMAINAAGHDTQTFDINIVAGSVLQVEISPTYYEGRTGDDIVLTCVADRAQSIQWYKENGDLPYTARTDSGRLTIYSARAEDSGTYICSATSYDGTRGTKTVSVTVSDSSGSPPSVSMVEERITIREGDSKELVCQVTGSPTPTVKWSKVRDILNANFEQIGNVLHIKNAHIQDRGLYLCVAENSLGVAQGAVSVEVTRFEAPLVTLYPEGTITTTAGASIQFQCRAMQGYPSPTITWTRADGSLLSSNTEVMFGGNIKIMSIRPSDAGDYICTATNDAGTAKATATVVVQTIPELYLTPSDSYITLKHGAYLKLDCQGTGIPQPTVNWEYLPRGIQAYSGAGDTRGLSAFATLERNQVTVADSGIYTCIGINSAGKTSKQVQVEVLPDRGDVPGGDFVPVQPERPLEFEEFRVSTGMSAQIRCAIQGLDTDTQIRWVRANDEPLPENAYVRDTTLYLDNIQQTSSGDYECVISSGQPGAAPLLRYRARVVIVALPRITLNPVRQEVFPGDNAYIHCVATGDPPINIKWAPVNRTMPETVYTRDGYISFTNIKVEDAGKYRCTARNDFGEADSVAEVIVTAHDQSPVIEAENHAVVARRGSTLNVQCRVNDPTGLARIEWTKYNEDLPANAEVVGNTLILNAVETENSGRYFCEKFFDGGSLTDYVDLTIEVQQDCYPGFRRCNNGQCFPEALYCDGEYDCDDRSDEIYCSNTGTAQGPSVKSLPSPPSLHITPYQTEYQAGETADLMCQSNEPGVIPTWSKLSGGLADNVQNRAGRLVIYDVRAENEGVYRCEATGQRGNYYRDFTLAVRENEATDETPIQVQRAKRSASVILECKTDLEEPVSYYWTKQGGNLPVYVDQAGKMIRLNSVGAVDAGTYVCTATNQKRTLEIPIILVVTGIIPYFTQAPNSYITLPTLPDAYLQFSFEISFKPESDYGLILYNGNREKDKDSDFISLALDNSVPVFKFNLGPGTSTTVIKATEPITNREWHTIKVTRNKKRVILFVDGKGPYHGENDGKYFGLDLTGPLYLGGVPDYNDISSDVRMDRGLVGCISKFKVGYSYQDILQDSQNSTGLTNCETCTENKCQNQGACQEASTTQGYTCICPVGFSGPTCNKRKGEACSPYACGVGRCIDTEDGYHCQCPYGRSGKHCEKTIQIMEPAFRNNAYIAYPPLRPLRRTKMEMKIKPKDLSDGVILYAAETNEGHGDFVSLAVRDRHLEFKFDNGQRLYVVRSERELVPNQWANVLAIKSVLDARIVVDGHTSPPTKITGNHKTLSLLTPVYIGGYDKFNIKLNKGVKVEDGFNGCISEIQISGMDTSQLKNITDSSNVEDCAIDKDDTDNNLYSPQYAHENQDTHVSYDNAKTGCSDNPCKNNAQCTPLSPVDYRCTCLDGFTGRNCDSRVDFCKNKPCQRGGTCRSTRNGFACDCPLGFTGTTCDQRIELRNDAHFNGDGWLEFSRSLLSHQNDNDQEIIALEFSTNKTDGLIFWHGQGPSVDGRRHDYISLAVTYGYLEFSYDLGDGSAVIADSHIRVDDGERHSVILKRQGIRGSMEIDHTYAEAGSASGTYTSMNCHGNIYLGGAPNISKMTGGRFTKGFDGCIHGFEIQQSKTLDLGVKAINGLNVKPCSSFLDTNNLVDDSYLLRY